MGPTPGVAERGKGYREMFTNLVVEYALAEQSAQGMPVSDPVDVVSMLVQTRGGRRWNHRGRARRCLGGFVFGAGAMVLGVLWHHGLSFKTWNRSLVRKLSKFAAAGAIGLFSVFTGHMAYHSCVIWRMVRGGTFMSQLFVL